MDIEKRIEELERQIRELQTRPPAYVPMPVYPQHPFHPYRDYFRAPWVGPYCGNYGASTGAVS